MHPRRPAVIQVGIPWRPTDDRMPAFEQTTAFYRNHGFEVVAADQKRPGYHFNIAAARNRLVRELMRPSTVYVLSDADTIPQFESLCAAILGVLRGSGAVHLPYHLYEREGAGGGPNDPRYIDGACSGILVFGPEVWHTLAGQDEAFEGWGFEDTAFRLAHETLIGPMVRYAGTVRALRHTPAGQNNVPVNRRRYLQYRDAYGNQAAMRLLLGAPWPFSPQSAPAPATMSA